MPLPTFPISGILEQTPDPLQKATRVRLQRNNSKNRVELKVSRDTGATYRVILPEPTAKTKIGSTLTIQENGDAEWAAPAEPATGIVDVVYADLVYAGTLVASAQFGYYVAPAAHAMKCTGVQIFLQGVATGAAVRIDLVTASGTEAGKVASLPVSTEYVQKIFATPLLLPAGSAWRIKLKQVGSTLAGEFLSVRLLLIPA